MNFDLLTLPSLVLLIDCWPTPANNTTDKTWHNVVEFCYSNPYIQTISAVSYDGYRYDVTIEEPWWSQSDYLFNQTTKWDFLRENWRQFNFLKHNPARPCTSPIIRDMKIRPDQTQLMIANTLQLAYYCNYINPSIENIIIMGYAWDHCLKTRAIGWCDLSYSIQYGMFRNVKNILTKKDCVLTADYTQPEFESPWFPIDDQFAYLDHSKHNINT